jgi:hypothetical protein
MKNVLVVYFSQSGQLLDISKNIVQDLEKDDEISVNYYEIKLKESFPFPWNRKDFYNAFPESFLQIPSDLDDVENPLLQKKYDLIIFSYQVWYLTPSIPINSFLKSAIAKKLMNDTPIVTVIGCRNMWIMAQEKVKKLLVQNKANLVGHIALVDRSINHISVITIVQWMFTGVKKRYLGIFPKPGVSNEDIENSKRFGNPILKALKSNNFSNLQEDLLAKKSIKIKPFLLTVDKRANMLFGKWANLIIKKGDKNSSKRYFWIKLFNFYLVFAIWIIAPLVFIVYLLTYPLLYKKIKKDIKYYSSVKTK